MEARSSRKKEDGKMRMTVCREQREKKKKIDNERDNSRNVAQQ